MGFVGDAVKGIGKGIGWVADKVTDIPVVGDIARVGTNFIPGVGPLVSAGLNAADAYYDGQTGGQQSTLGMMSGMGAGGYGMAQGGGGFDLMKILPMILGGAGSIYGAINANQDSSRSRELAEQAITTAQQNQQQNQARYDKYLPMYEQGLANFGPVGNPFFSNPMAGLSQMGQAPTRQAMPQAPQRISQSAVQAATGPANIPGWSGADIQQGFQTPPWEGYGQGNVYQDLNKLFDPTRFQSPQINTRRPLSLMKGLEF
jgi:hypothetical protein